ncbi:MAG TPA: hypothetical protein VMX18_00730 [Candidatus Bipolaricaulota bacterium]|nr:hypothetical protein [Candidatus Bipolaricaulota bacterium]
MKDLESLKNLLSGKARSKLARPLYASIVLDKFKMLCREKLSPDIYRSLKFVSYKNKTIKIGCSSSVVAQEIKLRERELILQLGAKLKGSMTVKIAIIINSE